MKINKDGMILEMNLNSGEIFKRTYTADTEYSPRGYDWIIHDPNPVNFGGIPFSAEGGVITTADGWTYHTFTESGVFDLAGEKECEVFILAGGGGGGGSYYPGGGGAGGLIQKNLFLVTGAYPIIIGAGGAGGDSTGGGSNGENSEAFGEIAIGGGLGSFGHQPNIPAQEGGCGGGGANNSKTGAVGLQGNSGGNNTINYCGGGGGGQGSVGGNSLLNHSTSNGGESIAFGNSLYAAGGCGCRWDQSNWSPKKDGIGGAAIGYTGTVSDLSLAHGNDNTGSGGGAIDKRASNYTQSGNGGSGIVIIRYKA
jgi:hypothetical protein